MDLASNSDTSVLVFVLCNMQLRHFNVKNRHKVLSSLRVFLDC